MNLTEAEWKVMKAVWQRIPASTRDVLEVTEPETSWAYSTVKTILDRLVEKGALKSRLRANTLLYEPVLSREQARRSAIRSLAEKAFDGAIGPLMQFMLAEEELTDRDRRALLRLLEEEEREEENA